MNEVLNFIKSLSKPRMFKSGEPSRQEINLAKMIKTDAQQLAALAEQEMKNGQAAQNLALAAADKNKLRAFVEIAVWHLSRAAEKYFKSADRLLEAGKLVSAKRRAFNLKAGELLERAFDAEAAISLLNNLVKN